jgi:hypothetical protein
MNKIKMYEELKQKNRQKLKLKEEDYARKKQELLHHYGLAKYNNYGECEQILEEDSEDYDSRFSQQKEQYFEDFYNYDD